MYTYLDPRDYPTTSTSIRLSKLLTLRALIMRWCDVMSIRGLGCGGFSASGPIGRLLTMTVGPSIGDVVAYSSSSSSRPLLLGV